MSPASIGDQRPLIVMADGPDGPLPQPEAVAASAGLDDPAVVLGWVVREPPWLRTGSSPVSTFMTGMGTRSAVAAGLASAVPARLSAVPGLLAGRWKPDVFVVGAHETPSGFFLAHSPGFVSTGLREACSIVVERWSGDPPASAPSIDRHVTAVIDRVDPPDPRPDIQLLPSHRMIGDLVAELVPPGATIQWGPGVIGAAVIASLRRPVQVRSGLVTDELVALDEKGLLEGPAVSAYTWGGAALAEMASDGRLRLTGVETTHDLNAISGMDRFFAVNTALQVGLDGSANVERVAGRVVSGPGGHPDFALGASRSSGGLSIVALAATAGENSTIVVAPETVTTPRSDVDMVVTEFGVADLRGLDDLRRAERIVSVAAPEHRARLRRDAGLG